MPAHRLLQTLMEQYPLDATATFVSCFRDTLLSQDAQLSRHIPKNAKIITELKNKLSQAEGCEELMEQLEDVFLALPEVLSSDDESNNDQNGDRKSNLETHRDDNKKSTFNRTDSGIYVSRVRTLSFEASGHFSELNQQALLERIQRKPDISSLSQQQKNNNSDTASESSETSFQRKQDVSGLNQNSDPDSVSQSSESSFQSNEGKTEGNDNVGSIGGKGAIKKAGATLLGLTSKLKGKLTRKEGRVDLNIDGEEQKGDGIDGKGEKVTVDMEAEAQRIVAAFKTQSGTINKVVFRLFFKGDGDGGGGGMQPISVKKLKVVIYE